MRAKARDVASIAQSSCKFQRFNLKPVTFSRGLGTAAPMPTDVKLLSP